MAKKDLVYDLFNFIRTDETTSVQKLKEATDSAYAGVGKENDDMLKEHEELVKSTNLFTRMPEDLLVVTRENEGRLPADPSCATPDQIKTLAEGEKEEKSDIKTDNAGITEKPEETKLQKAMEKETPDVDKKSDFKVAAKVETAKKVEPEITGVEVGKDKELKDEKNKPMKEGTLVKDPSVATYDQIQTLSEERALVTVSDKNVAEDIAKKYPGGRVVADTAKNQFVVMVTEVKVLKEETTSAPTEAEVSAEAVPYVKDKEFNKLTAVAPTDPKEPSIASAEANKEKYHEDPMVGPKGASTGKQDAPTGEVKTEIAKGVADQNASKKRDDETQQVLQHSSDPKGEPTTDPGKPEVKDTNAVAGTKAVKADKLTPESKIKEETEVTITSDGKTATVSLTPDGVNVSTGTSAEGTDSTEIAPAEEVSPEVTPEVSPEVPSDEDFSDEEATEFAERIFVSDYLTGLGEAKLTEKQKAFIAETKAKKMSKKSKEMVDKKVKGLKDKYGRTISHKDYPNTAHKK